MPCKPALLAVLSALALIFCSQPVLAEGYDTKEKLLKAATLAIEEKNIKEFIGLYEPGTVNERAEQLLAESILPLLEAGAGKGAFAIPKGNEKAEERKIGFIDIRFKNDPNTMMSFAFGKFSKKYYLMMSQHMAELAKQPAPIVVPEPEPVIVPNAPVRSTELKYRVHLKNGDSFESAVERDANGLWAEIAPGVRTYFSNGEISKVIELGKTVTVTDTLAQAPVMPAAVRPAAPAAPAPKKTDPKAKELLDAVKESIQDRDQEKFMALYSTDGVDKQMLDSLRPFVQGILAGTVTSVTLEPPSRGDNEPYEHEGYRYKPSLPVIGNIKFVLKEYPNSSMSTPFGGKDDKYYLVTSVKEKIANYVPPPSGPVLLDGQTFEGTTGKHGETIGKEDTYEFKDGKFSSSLSRFAGYKEGAYTARMQNDSVYFTAQTGSSFGGKKEWFGFIVNGSLSGGVTTVENGKTEENYIMGKLKE